MKNSKEERIKTQSKFYLAQAKWNKQEYLDKRCECSCECCGVKFPIELIQFHHPNPDEKEKKVTVSQWYGRKGANKKTLDEAEKCMVLCSPCHYLEHIAWLFNESILDDKETYNRFRNHRVREPNRGDYLDDWDERFPDRQEDQLLLPVRLPGHTKGDGYL